MTADRGPIAGRVVVTARAYERIAAAVSADALGIPRHEAKARVRDDRGRLAAEVTAGAGRDGGPIVDRAARARDEVSGRLADLTGAAVSTVRIRISHLIDDDRRTS